MRKLTVAVSAGLEKAFESVREIVSVQNADWMEVSAAVLSSSDIEAGRLDEIKAQHLNLPVFASHSKHLLLVFAFVCGLLPPAIALYAAYCSIFKQVPANIL